MAEPVALTFDEERAIEARTMTIMALLHADDVERTYKQLWGEAMVPYQRLAAWTFPGHDAALHGRE